MKKLYNLYAGLGGGFGGAGFEYQEEFHTLDEAKAAARALAVEEYESYEGIHGILDRDEIAEQYEESEGCRPTDEVLEMLYNEEVESWIDYWVAPAEADPDWNYQENRSNK